MYINAQWKEIYDAINLDNADLLDSLVPPINIFNGKEKYWSNELYLRYCWQSDDTLSHAITLGHTSCIRILLDKIYSGDLNPALIHGHFSYGVTPLLCACKRCDLNLVRELVERGSANIHEDEILLAAIQQNDEIFVDYLLNKGCNPQSTYNKYILCEASRCGYLGIVKNLLKHGADPNTQDYSNRTAFDYAILKRDIEIAKVLLLHTHGHITTTNDNFTPMMLAAHYNLRPIVDLLFELLPLDRAVDDLLRLACRYTIDRHMLDGDNAFYFFAQGLNGKQTSDNPILYEVYEFHHECQTFDELISIQNDNNAMRMHALLVNERIFRQHGDIAIYFDLVEKQCDYYHDNQLFHRCLQIRIHAYQLIRRVQNDSYDQRRWHDNKFDSLVKDLQNILRQSGVVPVDSLVIIFNWIFDQNMIVSTFLQLNLLKIVICVSIYSIVQN
ncbi:unnamed protein product [Rotaria sordida]|uniref:Uncharacterized protein n=1 Tax=Rotaria sordida TaxID=392033 RepID=A0A815HFL7_9BILA|nr:unnamed protein product [Rotaria sordida]CAF4075471.1 unnamed protein product [Rotaria sordida]